MQQAVKAAKESGLTGERLVARLPQPDFVVTLGNFYRLAGDETAAQQQYDTVAFIADLETTDQVLVGRQLALFYANRFSQDEFADLLSTALDQPGAIAIALVVAFGLGAAHALTSGHGKTIEVK